VPTVCTLLPTVWFSLTHLRGADFPVYWPTGLLVYWSTGLLVYWPTGPLVWYYKPVKLPDNL